MVHYECVHDGSGLQLRQRGSRITGCSNGLDPEYDSVLSKNFGFAVAEKNVTAQFRIESFNLFNTAQFAAPNGAVTSAYRHSGRYSLAHALLPFLPEQD
jgi:hypothetical protein